MDLQTVLEKYIQACHTHGSETVISLDYSKVNKANSQIMKNIKILMSSEEGIALAKAQLYNEDVYVSSWTATLLIFDYPKECKKVIKSVIKDKGIWAGSIRTFYEEWKKGNMKKMY